LNHFWQIPNGEACEKKKKKKGIIPGGEEAREG
jgi:hypothetical protein